MKMKQTINERFTKLKQRKFKSELKRKQKLEQFAAENNIEYTYDAPYTKTIDNSKLFEYVRRKDSLIGTLNCLALIQTRMNEYLTIAEHNRDYTKYSTFQALAIYTVFRDHDVYITNKIAAELCDISVRSLENIKKRYAKDYVNTYHEFRKPRSNE
jgi:hypothetical protein